MNRRPPLARPATVLLTAAGLAIAGLALTGPSAQAARPGQPRVHPVASGPSAARLADIRARQQQMIADHRPAPTLPRAGVTTFTVDTTEDSTLADAMGTTCVDTTSGKCSLRAAVDAADNLKKPVKIVLAAKTYMLSTASVLDVSNPGGTYLVGKGSSKTTIQGAGSGLFEMNASTVPGQLSITGVKLTGGMAADGGAINMKSTVTGSTLVLDGVLITGNSATARGGGIHVDGYASLYARNTTITDNEAPQGSGMYSYWADSDFVGTRVDGNHGPAVDAGAGGGMYLEYGVLRMTGGSISKNTVGGTMPGYGAGFENRFGHVTLTGVHVDKNVASVGGVGGGAYVYQGLMEVNRGTISGNRADGAGAEGGGIYTDTSAQVALHGVTMKGNKITGTTSGPNQGGGAIYSLGGADAIQLTIDAGTTITGSNEGAVYAWLASGQLDLKVDRATISSNSASNANGWGGYGCGGAICLLGTVASGYHLDVSRSTFTGNSSMGDGAGGAISLFTADASQASLAVDHSTFRSNTSGAGGTGGAVSVMSGSGSVRLAANTFTGNKAGSAAVAGTGGAVALQGNVQLSDNGSTFSGNRAIGNGAFGGAVWADTRRSMTFVGSTFSQNSAGAGQDTGYGGAVASSDYYGDTFRRVSMLGNTAAESGGGFYGSSAAYDVLFDSSTISGNRAGNSATAGSGGGVYTADAVLVLENSTVTGNSAVSSGATLGQGGGILYSGSAFGLRYSTVSGNSAAQGGGIYTDGYGGNLLASIVSANHTKTGGPEQDCTNEVPGTTLHSRGGNVLGQKGCVTALTSSDAVTAKPGLGPLKKNGGPTMTMAISKKSPAVGRASFLVPATDQRGVKRPSSKADAGAYELTKAK